MNRRIVLALFDVHEVTLRSGVGAFDTNAWHKNFPWLVKKIAGGLRRLLGSLRYSRGLEAQKQSGMLGFDVLNTPGKAKEIAHATETGIHGKLESDASARV